jgi:hypothetical protein
MEIVGGFMVMMSIIGFFLAVIWLIMPFVVFAIKGKQDRTLEVLEAIEQRLAALELRSRQVEADRRQTGSGGPGGAPSTTCDTHAAEHAAPPAASEKTGTEAPPAVERTGGLY